jgi:predicted TIM-barrel fold metal-dependent hydrolase
MDENERLQVRDEDREFFARELAAFVPHRIYDAHAHLWDAGHGFNPDASRPARGDAAFYRARLGELCPGREVSAYFIPPFLSSAEGLDAGNAFVAGEAARGRHDRAAYFVTPEADPEKVREDVRRLGVRGLKCYHLFAAKQPTWEADLPEYLPEPLVRVAHDENLAITLHMVKSRAVADPSNLYWIRRYCETYPNMTLILAHSARAFQPAHGLEGLPRLTGLANLYFDCSANCEPLAHQAILRLMGHDRLMYGSDFWVSHLRGRSLGVADSFVWLYEDSPIWKEKQATIRPVAVGLEQLRSLKWACWSERLTDSQVEDIFWNNAARVFGVG